MLAVVVGRAAAATASLALTLAVRFARRHGLLLGAFCPLLLGLLDALVALLLLGLYLRGSLLSLMLVLLGLLDALLALRVLRRGLGRGRLHLRAALLEALAHDGITRLIRVAA